MGQKAGKHFFLMLLCVSRLPERRERWSSRLVPDSLINKPMLLLNSSAEALPSVLAAQKSTVLWNTDTMYNTAWCGLHYWVHKEGFFLFIILSWRWIHIHNSSTAVQLGGQITSLGLGTFGDDPVAIELQNENVGGGNTRGALREREMKAFLLRMQFTDCSQKSWFVFMPLFDFCL